MSNIKTAMTLREAFFEGYSSYTSSCNAHTTVQEEWAGSIAKQRYDALLQEGTDGVLKDYRVTISFGKSKSKVTREIEAYSDDHVLAIVEAELAEASWSTRKRTLTVELVGNG